MRNYVIIFIQIITYYYEKMVVGFFSSNVMYLKGVFIFIYRVNAFIYAIKICQPKKDASRCDIVRKQIGIRDKTLNTRFDPV